MRPFEQDGGGVSASAAGSGHGVSRKVSHDGHDVLLTEVFFPEISEWRPVLERLGVSQQAAIAAAVRAREHACDFQSALLADALADRSDLLRAVAAELGLDVVETIDPERIVITQENAITLLRGRNGRVPVKLMGRSGDVAFLISSERLRLDAMRRQMAAHPSLARHLRLVDPQILRQAILEHARPLLTRRAVTGLGERYPAFSARIVANAWQGMTIGTTMTLVPVGLLLARSSVLAVSHVIATVFFFACVSLRFAAAASIQPPRPPASIPMPEGEKPVYSVLVALYQEAAIVPSLIAALDRLVWPRDRLDIKLVCEEGDTGTLAVIGALELPPHIEVVVVPRRGPKTKPKALAYALQMAGGEFVVLYDAEDSPHPMQLIEAWQRFCQAGPDLAAIQAPLEISNGNANLLARMFAFEYAGLFRGLLPWLSQRRLMLPLGGTSNHFRDVM